jgi:hypothetical protein
MQIHPKPVVQLGGVKADPALTFGPVVGVGFDSEEKPRSEQLSLTICWSELRLSGISKFV